MAFYLYLALVGGAAVAGTLLGLKLGQGWARILLLISLAVLVGSFALYVTLTNYGRSVDQWSYRRVADSMAFITWPALYAAAGFLGPALVKNPAAATTLSIGAALVSLTLGTYMMFMLACGLAGECL